MPANTWRTIPAANKLSDLKPANNPLINPDYPAQPEWDGVEGQGAVIADWCGACYDRSGDVLHLPLSGGHNGYGGNEPYKIALNADTPIWEMPRKPSGAIGNILTTRDGNEVSGVYSDGRPRATHSYNKPVYVPSVGPFMAIHGLVSYTNSGGSGKAIRFDPITAEPTFLADNIYAGLGSNGEYGGSCYDPLRHSIWFLPAFGWARMTRYDIASNTWQTVGDQFMTGGNAGCYLPDDDCILFFCNLFTNGVGVWDCATGTMYYPSISGAPVGGINLAVGTYGSVSPTWVPSLNAAAFWDNASATTQINLITKPANPRTGTWTISQLPVAGSNTVTPTARIAAGTYGRFQYSPRQNGFFLINGVSQDLYFYSLG